MDLRLGHLKFSILFVCIVIIASIFLLTDARLFAEQGMNGPLEPKDVEAYGLGSPYALPPLESLPSSMVSSPSSPNSPIKSPPDESASPPMYTPMLRPPQYELNPPSIAPSPHYHGPSPPIDQSPAVHPPSIVVMPPPPHKMPQFAVWCVAKPTMPDPIIQEALDYACGSGADCRAIQPNGPCFQPDNLVSHASYAFNSYWQKTKVAGGTCDFGGTAMLVTVDPSFNNCYFVSS
ncbi:glucan endo-1,3-beta-glucosidase 12 [Hevea brasiliensis]|nr:glucan endo-1,3-beta-glucosidase 12 [Hevea brasiliensis]